ncbi:PQQ-dependent sugar dehydrogenase [Compostibacter hankyongensis]|uniref:PQQ-dependent sugar dehydrogenase n=1 Tax=Compostibacter hankyongensis TaxID=1007089 RepID=A0ABP8G5E3_9BACT
MIRKVYPAIVICAFMIAGSACHSPSGGQQTNAAQQDRTAGDSKLTFTLEKITDSLDGPVALENAHDGSGRLFVGEQGGRIRIIKDGKLLKTPFLDIRSSLVHMENKYMNMGLLGFAFHPDFKNNGRFFVHYIAPSHKKGFSNKSVLEEFRVSRDNPDKAESTGRVILEVDQPAQNRNGGNIAFGKDGDLYMSFGDGGDKHGKAGNSQDLDQLLGKIIRIDVDHGSPYRVPDDNPFVDKKARPEIWAYGFRMPWRISFDAATGALFCGDVGESNYEEVDLIRKGGNYGWRVMEASHVHDTSLYGDGGGFIAPITEYKHSTGVCLIGGYVYRGSRSPALQGRYVFGDWSGRAFYLEQKGDQWIRHRCRFEGRPDTTLPFKINSFGEGEDRELYMVTQDTVGALSPTGVIYHVAAR